MPVFPFSEILNRSTLDVVCLQEVLWRWNLAALRELCSTFPYVAYAAQGPAIAGGLVTLSRWPIADDRYVVYRVRTPRHRPRVDWFLRKGLLITRIEIAGHR